MLTVLLATRNGASTLPRVLGAFLELTEPPGGWELVVVDNGSTDETGALLAGMEGRLPLTVLHEPRPGKNVALNSALDRLDGDLVVLTDDDIVPRPGWLPAYRRAATAHGEVDIFGGPLLPEWEVSPEPWLVDWVPGGPAFALLPPRPDGPIEPRAVFGGNMAVRTKVFTDGYRFSTDVGPNTTQYAMGGETELLMRLDEDGHQAWHVPDAEVAHIIRRHQMTRAWVMGRAERFGRGQGKRSSPDRPIPSIFGVPRWLYRDYVACMARAAWARIRGDGKARFEESWHARYLIGWAKEARAKRRGPPRSG